MNTRLLPDVLVPQGGLGRDESCHEVDTTLIVDHDHLDPTLTKKVLGSHERPVLTDHNLGYAEEEDGSGAHVTRGEGRVYHGASVLGGAETARVVEGVHLGVKDGRPLLDPSVVTPADYHVVDHEGGADGNPTFVSSHECLFDGCFEPDRAHRVDHMTRA